ncbi:hypothetical protein Fmac_008175 [Flemingia macrophylla]|uniref:Uncharacterized protein n=1 Tax=Flemingia macrophylla TaxID=520843 RepID=A0ABD1MZ19_9FABA
MRKAEKGEEMKRKLLHGSGQTGLVNPKGERTEEDPSSLSSQLSCESLIPLLIFIRKNFAAPASFRISLSFIPSLIVKDALSSWEPSHSVVSILQKFISSDAVAFGSSRPLARPQSVVPGNGAIRSQLLGQPLFLHQVNEDIAKRDVMFKIAKQWREYRIKLWNEFYDPLLSRNDLIKNVPEGLSMDQWALFVDYRLKPSTMKIETGRTIGRGEMWKITHKRKNGSYVNDEAMEIGEGGSIPAEMAALFRTAMHQAADVGSGTRTGTESISPT